MSIKFSPPAAMCTAFVLGGFAALASAQMPVGLLGSWGMERAGVLPIERGGVARSDRHGDIIGAVLLFEAGRPGRRNLCLRLAPEGVALEQEKRAIRALQEQIREAGGDMSALVADMDRLRNPQRAWMQARAGPEPGEPLGTPEANQLRLAETTLLGAPELGKVDFELDARNVPAEFRSSEATCNPLYFTAPAVAGEVAFVEIDHRCGPQCRDAWLYAVALREERWVVEALSRTWP